MIIDCHTHIGRNEHINANVTRLLTSMDKAGIDKSLVFAGKLNDAANDWMLEQIAPHKDRLLGVAAAHPQLETYQHDKDEIGRLVEWYQTGQIVAVKFYVGYYHYYPSDVSHYLQALNEIGCPAIFHCGDCLNSVKKAKLKYAHPLNVDEVAVDFPDMNFIIAHVGYPWVRDTAEVCYKNANVFTDISGFVYGEFQPLDQRKFENMLVEYLQIASSDKLLFGTDWPISSQESYRRVMDLNVRDMSRNVQRAFKLGD